MRYILLLLLSVWGYAASSQSYQLWKGKIDQYPVSIHLHHSGHQYFGYYYYDSRQQPVYFTGDDTTYAGKIRLLGMPGKEDHELFVFTVHEDKIEGTWQKTDKDTPLSLTGSKFSPSDVGYVFTEGTLQLRKISGKEVPQADFSAGTVWPSGNTPSDEFVRNEIRSRLRSKNNHLESIDEILQKEKDDFLKEYQKEYVHVADSEVVASPFAYSMTSTRQIMICFSSADFLSLASLSYEYSGGAHGNYGTTYSTLDRVNKKRIALTAIIAAKNHQALNRLLEKNFRIQAGLKAKDALQEGGLFNNKLEANDNFYITGKGILFNYVPYEVGPYAMGEVQIFVSFKELQPYLQPNFIKRIAGK